MPQERAKLFLEKLERSKEAALRIAAERARSAPGAEPGPNP
jgi:hypothetical protein